MFRSLVLIGLSALAGCSRFGGGAADASRVRKLESEVAELSRSIAGADAYIRTVVTAHSVQDDGTLTLETAPFYNVGSVFTIDRGTGIYRGGVGTNAGSDKRDVVFVPPDNSFYVASTSQGPNTSIDYLAVQDFTPGHVKPFALATFSYVLTGTCER